MMRSGLTGWALAIARTLEAEGVDYEILFRKVGMDPSCLTDGQSRYWQYSFSRLWCSAINQTDDPYFGLKLANFVRPSTFHVLGYAMSCSTTWGAALQRFARYAKLVSNSANVALTESHDGWHMKFSFDTGAEVLPQNLDAVIAGLVCFGRWITCEDTSPLEVRFKHPLLGDYKEYERVLRCPVWFDQQEDSLTFGRDAVNRAVPSANEQLAVMLDDMAVQNLAGLSGRFSAKVRESLLKQFAVGDVSKHRTAECMHMTERTLLRRLREEGTTFRDVLDELREELAYKYMKKPDATVEEVSALLGFSDASTFSRAFKRWTGRRPSCVRQDFLDLNNAEVVPPL